MLTLTQVVFRYDAGDLSNESDETLLAIRTGIEQELATAPDHIDSIFGRYLIQKYNEIVGYINQLLTRRYGCDD
ncbi:hypothetical protein [Larkinella sp. GY13]